MLFCFDRESLSTTTTHTHTHSHTCHLISSLPQCAPRQHTSIMPFCTICVAKAQHPISPIVYRAVDTHRFICVWNDIWFVHRREKRAYVNSARFVPLVFFAEFSFDFDFADSSLSSLNLILWLAREMSEAHRAKEKERKWKVCEWARLCLWVRICTACMCEQDHCYCHRAFFGGRIVQSAASC